MFRHAAISIFGFMSGLAGLPLFHLRKSQTTAAQPLRLRIAPLFPSLAGPDWSRLQKPQTQKIEHGRMQRLDVLPYSSRTCYGNPKPLAGPPLKVTGNPFTTSMHQWNTTILAGKIRSCIE
jgi:hypothetical protein